MAGDIEFLGVVLESMLYGTLILLSLMFMYLMKAPYERLGTPVVLPAAVMFALATAHYAVDVHELFHVDVDLAAYRPSSVQFEASLIVAYVQTHVWDAFILFRLSLAYRHKLRIAAPPLCLFICSMAISIALAVQLVTNSNPTSGSIRTLALTFDALTLAGNLCASSLISVRLWPMATSISAGVEMHSKRLRTILAVANDSGALYSAALAIYMVTSYTSSAGQVVMRRAMPPAIGIILSLTSIRIALGADALAKTRRCITRDDLDITPLMSPTARSLPLEHGICAQGASTP